MKKTYGLSIFYVAVVLLTMTFFPTSVFAGKGDKNNPLWQAADKSALPARPTAVPDNVPVYRLNRKLLDEIFAKAPREFTDAAREVETILEIPTPDGEMMRFRIEESPMLSAEVAAQFPTWKQFVGQGIDDPTATASFDTNDLGFHAYVLSGRGTFLIDPYSQTDKTNYIVYYKGAVGDGNRAPFSCKIGDHESKGDADFFDFSAPQAFTNGTELRTLKSAWSLTKEYTAFFGNNKTTAFAALTTTVSRMNTIFRRELAVTFTVVSDLRTVYDSTDDGGFPPSNDSDVAGKSLNNNARVLDAIYGRDNYDIGHVLSVTASPNGLALSPSLCSNQLYPAPTPTPSPSPSPTPTPGPIPRTAKAQGFTGAPVPQGDGFDVDYVAHEIGHQFAMSHTFNNDVDGSCSTRATDSAYEPASGITIMGYGGICAPRNLAKNSIEYFNLRSFDQGLGYLQSTNPNTNPLPTPCGTVTATNNTAPTVTSPGNFTIPRLTPFTLTASATDPDGDALTYLWEEFDLGGATGSMPRTEVINGVPTIVRPGMPVDADDDGTARPIFRAYNATTGGARTFPSLFYILNPAGNDTTANVNSVAGNQPTLNYTGTLPFAPTTGSTNGYVCAPTETCVRGERLPTIVRTMKFRATVRDNRAGGGGVADAESDVTVAAGAGPFQVTTQNASPVSWQANTPQTVTWDVAGTTANNINAANVNILLSTDGGQTFPITILANTPNDGTQSITVPNNPTTQARIKIQPVGNIFFDISNVNFTITAAVTITVNPATLPNGTTGTAYNETITATGGTAPYVFTVTTGTLPTGLTLTVGGILSGTPTTAATSNFTVTATDAGNNTGSRAYSITIAAPQPQTFVVDTTADNGALTACTTAPNDCSLRGAIATANVTTVADTIEFDATVFAGTQTITMTGDHFRVQGGPLTINGTGANRLTIDGGTGTNRIFYINSVLLTLQGMTLTGGNGTGDVSPQAASAEGGAILSLGNGRLAANEINVTGNTATGQGGGIYLSNGGRIENSTFSQNQAPTGPGGALVVLGNSTIINSTFTGNTSGVYGGAISYVNSTHTLDSCTITGNTSTNAAFTGGGIFVQGGGTLNIGNSIIAGNITPMGNQPEIRRQDTTFAVTSRGFNLIGASAGNAASTTNPITYQSTDILDTPPQLDPLANYGGTTPTMRLRTGSPAIDKGLSTLPTPLTGLFMSSNDDKDSVLLASARDQRGSVRPSDNLSIPNPVGGNGADIGAFEVLVAPTAAPVTISGRVLTNLGRGIANARVAITDQNGDVRTARTNSFGYYRFDDVAAGQTYIFNVTHKSYQFTPRVVSVFEGQGKFDFVADN